MPDLIANDTAYELTDSKAKRLLDAGAVIYLEGPEGGDGLFLVEDHLFTHEEVLILMNPGED